MRRTAECRTADDAVPSLRRRTTALFTRYRPRSVSVETGDGGEAGCRALADERRILSSPSLSFPEPEFPGAAARRAAAHISKEPPGMTNESSRPAAVSKPQQANLVAAAKPIMSSASAMGASTARFERRTPQEPGPCCKIA